MFSRILGAPVLLAAAVAIPYLSTNGSEGVMKWWDSVSASSSEEKPILPPTSSQALLDSAPRGPGFELYPVETRLEGNPSVSLEEVFRFDVTKEWVYERWARKSTALAELGLYGVRIPLVTGTQIHDLAGSLTYFFDATGKVERISFKGNTGDTTKIVMLAVQKYGLQQQQSPVVGEQIFQIKRGSNVFSDLRTKPSSVLWSSSPHNSFAVEFDLQRAEATSPLPERLAPLPKVTTPPPSEADAAKQAKAEAEEKKQGLRDSLKAFFPRSRVPSGQVENLERQDLIW
jgi:hypothetical protein